MGLYKKLTSKKETNTKQKLEIARASLFKRLNSKEIQLFKEEIKKQRKPIFGLIERIKILQRMPVSKWVKTGVKGFDGLLDKGIPKGTSVLVAGGAGSGKTIFCLDILNNAALNEEKSIYISLEESEIRLKEHMHDFGWNPEELEKKGLLKIVRVDPFAIARSVEALLAKAKGELKLDINEVAELIPDNFEPNFVFVDSLTALAAAFREEEDSYRIFIEQLFRYFEKLNVTSFLISETEQIPVRYSKSGVEEFLADGLIVLYHIRRGNIREHAIEVLKLRGANHQKKIVAMQIVSGKGLVVYPEQEIFGGIELVEK